MKSGQIAMLLLLEFISFPLLGGTFTCQDAATGKTTIRSEPCNQKVERSLASAQSTTPRSLTTVHPSTTRDAKSSRDLAEETLIRQMNDPKLNGRARREAAVALGNLRAGSAQKPENLQSTNKSVTYQHFGSSSIGSDGTHCQHYGTFSECRKR